MAIRVLNRALWQFSVEGLSENRSVAKTVARQENPLEDSLQLIEKLEREKGFEPSTLALARRCSTTELFPLTEIWSEENTKFY